MTAARSFFIADTCIGGLSVVKSMWDSGVANEAVFMTDYAINPLGIKSDSVIAEVADTWLKQAAEHSDTLVIACNTLSIRYHELMQSEQSLYGLKQVISMVDCFAAMVKIETDILSNKKVLIIGTEFTANQPLYPDILRAALPGTTVSSVSATDLERNIARLRLVGNKRGSVLSDELGQALENTDIAVLACTCFPLVQAELESLFPGVLFLDPGAYCSGLLQQGGTTQKKKLSIRVTGEVVSKEHITAFAKSYLGSDSIV